jgi:Zn-dependent protease
MDPLEIAVKLGIFFVPFLFSLCFHEYAHGQVAKWRGDNTAEVMGRLTMNPLAHLDMVGTVILPVVSILLSSPIFFGWAKPVPVNPSRLRSPRTDMFWVALAGPLSNVILAIVGAFVFAFLATRSSSDATVGLSLAKIMNLFVSLNLFLAFFNLIPIHPLDGGKVLARFLPPSINAKLEANEHISSWILLFLVLSGALTLLAYPVEAMSRFLLQMATQLVGG